MGVRRVVQLSCNPLPESQGGPGRAPRHAHGLLHACASGSSWQKLRCVLSSRGR